MATTQGDDGSAKPEAPTRRLSDAGTTEAAGWGGAPPPPALQCGDSVGRFIVLGPVGSGGMGVVFAAYDPELDRRVALKLLRAEQTPLHGGTEARARLLREGQAMARLRHPNVVTVFDVGAHGEQVFLAMEYVAGGTLRELAQRHRAAPGGWRAIVDAYVQAGRGLSAAHAAGMVHRDFKPTNVLVEGDRIQVTDFGIARTGASAASPGPSSGAPALPDADDADHADHAADHAADPTPTGALAGTAAYMAPERHRGRPADPRSDQFAFCVALYEALYGSRPFPGTTRAAVADAVQRGTIAAPDQRHDVPPWVDRALRRGLSVAPGARWPSMDALLQVLATPEAGGVGRRARVWIAAVLGVVLTIVPWSGATYGIPTDTTTYAGAVQQTLLLLGVVLALAVWARHELGATRFNRAAVATIVTVLLLQVPLELAHAALHIPIATSWVLHLLYWSSMTALFAILVDRRFVVLAGCYFVAFGVAAARPDLYGWVSSINNVAFIACVAWLSRGTWMK